MGWFCVCGLFVYARVQALIGAGGKQDGSFLIQLQSNSDLILLFSMNNGTKFLENISFKSRYTSSFGFVVSLLICLPWTVLDEIEHAIFHHFQKIQYISCKTFSHIQQSGC